MREYPRHPGDVQPPEVTRHAVTTARAERPDDLALAAELAASLPGRVVARRQRSVEELCADESLDGIIIVGDGEVCWRGPGGGLFWFHPNMAVNRVRPQAGGGERDPLVKALELQPGHHVLDATLGLGADAIVLSHLVGQSGTVWGIEASPVVACIVRWGLQHYQHRLAPAMRRIRVLTGSHAELLMSAEVAAVPWHGIVFDPMYERSRDDSHGLDGLRLLACYDRLDEATIERARELASGWVVVKGRPDEPWFGSLRPDREVAGRRRRVVFACFRGRRERALAL